MNPTVTILTLPNLAGCPAMVGLTEALNKLSTAFCEVVDCAEALQIELLTEQQNGTRTC